MHIGNALCAETGDGGVGSSLKNYDSVFFCLKNEEYCGW